MKVEVSECAAKPIVSEPCTDIIPYIAPKPVDRSALKLHLGFPCLDCGASLSSQSALNMHQRTHTGEKPYSCLFCSFDSAQSYRVTTHARSKHGDLLKPGAPTYFKKKDRVDRGLSEMMGYAKGFNAGHEVGTKNVSGASRYQPYGQQRGLGFGNRPHSEQGHAVGSFPRNSTSGMSGNPSTGCAMGPGFYQGRSEYVPVFETYVSLGNPSNQRSGIDLHSTANYANGFIGQQSGCVVVYPDYQRQGGMHYAAAATPQASLDERGGNNVTSLHGFGAYGSTIGGENRCTDGGVNSAQDNTFNPQGGWPYVAAATPQASMDGRGGNSVTLLHDFGDHGTACDDNKGGWPYSSAPMPGNSIPNGVGYESFGDGTPLNGGSFGVHVGQGGWPDAVSPPPSSLSGYSPSPGPFTGEHGGPVSLGITGQASGNGAVDGSLPEHGSRLAAPVLEVVGCIPDVAADTMDFAGVLAYVERTCGPFPEELTDDGDLESYFANYDPDK